jgi:hypothetical protein
MVSSTWNLRSAAFSIRTAARSGLLVDLANLRSVVLEKRRRLMREVASADHSTFP